MPMTDRERQIQNQLLKNIYNELSKRNIDEERYYEFLRDNTDLKFMRIRKIMAGINSRPITLKELCSIAKALDIDNPGYLLKDIK